MTKNSLAIAIEALSWMAYSGMGERTALFKAADQIGGATSELREAHKLIMETTRYQNRVEYLISTRMPKNQSQRTPHGITSFLKILTYLASVARASENDVERNVRWARQILGWQELHPYENLIGVIASRSLRVEESRLSEIDQVALRTCNPSWFVVRLIEIFGRAFALQLLQSTLKQPPTYVRVNSLRAMRTTAADFTIGSAYLLSKELGDVWRLDAPGESITRSKLWADGEIVVQDLASITAGAVTSPAKNDVVLDLCSAPGNKTSHLASIMEDCGEIYSVDNSAQRLSSWAREMKRTGCSIASPICADGRKLPFNFEVDTILVDPPCSNTGVLAKNPSIKWKITHARVKEYAAAQYLILQEASRHLRAEGKMVYCTCSLLPEENEEVIGNFLSRNPDFKLDRQTPFVASPGIRGFDRCQRFYPHLHQCNGYFIAKLMRSS